MVHGLYPFHCMSYWRCLGFSVNSGRARQRPALIFYLKEYSTSECQTETEPGEHRLSFTRRGYYAINPLPGMRRENNKYVC